MASIAMAVLAASVALGYFTIAGVVAPRIRMPTAPSRVVLVIRGAAIAFFIGCGMTHVHILVHTIGYGAATPVEAHELVFHAAQAVGAWLFIAGALMRLELHIVPAQTRTELVAAVRAERRIAQEAQTRARRDDLTGLARRWHFDDQLARQIALAQRHGVTAALILIDLDGLKLINDTHGHQAGDAALRHVADVMRREIRGSDVAARIGGDEFAVIVTEAQIDEAAAVAERIVVASRHAAGPDPHASVSAGVTAITGLLTADAVMHDADVALYAAKRAGGDRHALSRPDTVSLAV